MSDSPEPAPLPDSAIAIRQGELEQFGTTVWNQAVHYLTNHSNGQVTEQMTQHALDANPYRSL